MLWSLKLIRLGATRGFGAELRKALSSSTKNRYVAALVGAGVTTLLQSSTATVMIIATFAGKAMVTTAGALAIILGADVGTTLVAQLLSFDLSWLAPLLMIIGSVLFSFDKVSRAKNFGRICIGLGLLLFSLQFISASSEPMKASEALPLILKPLSGDPILALMVSALMTWVAHSSLAIVLLIMSLASSGVLPVPLALIMVLGANLGTTIAPLVATWRDAPAAVRVPAGNMLMRFIGVLALLPFVEFVIPLVTEFSGNPARMVVNFHTGFNIALAIIFLPFTGVISKICEKIVPDRIDDDDPARPKYLNQKEIDTPAVALASVERETLRMGDVLQDMLEDTISAFKSNDEGIVQQIREKDDIIDSLYAAIKTYMARLTQEAMDKDDADRYIQLLTFSTNLEHAGDIVDKNLMALAKKKIRKQSSFSSEGFKEIEHIHYLVLDSVKLSMNVLVSGDIKLARKLIRDKEDIRRAEIEASATHIERLREGVPETIGTSSLHLDVLRDYRRINSYVCNVAYPLLEKRGEIRSSRLKTKK